MTETPKPTDAPEPDDSLDEDMPKLTEEEWAYIAALDTEGGD